MGRGRPGFSVEGRDTRNGADVYCSCTRGLLVSLELNRPERALKGAVNTLRDDHPRLAVSTEEPEDDEAAVVSLVEGFGFDYQASCGTCAVDTDYRVKPVVLFFE